MLAVLKQKLLLILVFLGYFLIFEFLTFYNLRITTGNLLLDILFAFGLASFIILIKSHRGQVIYLSILILLVDVLYVTNVTMIKVFYDIFSLDKIFLINLVDDVFDWQFIPVGDLILGLCLFISYILINIFVIKLFKQKKSLNIVIPSLKKQTFVFLAVLVACILLFTSGVAKASNNIYINGKQFDDVFYVTSLKKSAFQHYGILSFYYKEIQTYLSSPKYEDAFPAFTERKTDYFGLLRNKNVITIMIESGQDMGINPCLTPNLYRLRSEGVYFQENYSVNKTNVSEHIGIAGSYPTTSYSFLTDNFELPFTLPNLLSDRYTTSFFHDNRGQFYHRDTLMELLGFEEIYLHDDLFPEALPNWDDGWSWGGDYTPDSVAIERIIPEMIKDDELFYSFWTTLSMHGPYNDNDDSNRNLFIDKGYFAQIDQAEELGLWENPLKGDETGEFQFKYYQAAMIDLDVAVGKLLDALKDKGILDDTVIVIYGDHQAYYHDLHLRLHDVNASESYRTDLLYDTILYMWNPTLNAALGDERVVTKFTSPYIIVPTLLDLLGETYDANWYLSYSVFDEDYLPVFYSHQQNALMNKYLYTFDGETVVYQPEEITSAEVAQFLTDCLSVLERQSEINKLYKKLND